LGRIFTCKGKEILDKFKIDTRVASRYHIGYETDPEQFMVVLEHTMAVMPDDF
jgi:hypothetical protein